MSEQEAWLMVDKIAKLIDRAEKAEAERDRLLAALIYHGVPTEGAAKIMDGTFHPTILMPLGEDA